MAKRKKAQTSIFPIRLKPGEDLRKSIEQIVQQESILAGYIAACAGSLTQYNIRFADAPEGTKANGHFEIVSLSGTLSTNGCHIHIAVSDERGVTTGGHLLEECLVYTTAEIVLVQLNTFAFSREIDGSTPWKELQIRKI